MSPGNGGTWARLLLGLAVAAVLALAALGLWAWQEADLAGGADLPAMGSAASDKSLGANADLAAYDVEARAEVLAAMEDAGLRWLRQRFPWDAIEPEEGAYDWTHWDRIVQAAEQQGFQVIAVLDGSPSWARAAADEENALAPPVEARHFGVFVSAFAERYGAQIDHYQVWEEPNIAPHWGAGEIDPAAYVHFLREAAIQIRSIDPGATILTAALAPNVEQGGRNMSDLLFLEELYQNGAAEWSDGVAAQLYDLEGLPDDPAAPDRLNWQRVTLLREVMERHGDGQTPVWAVSVGLGPTDMDSLTAAILATRENWPWLGPMIWAAWAPEDAQGRYSLVDGQSQPSLALDALRGLATAQSLAWPGAYGADHESGLYEGDWRVTHSGADIGASGDRLTIPFWGNRLDLAVRRGAYRAFLFVTVDGQPANALPRDLDSNAYVVLYDPLGENDAVTLARGLSDGAHVAEIVAERGWGQWAIKGWTVWRERPGGFPWRGLSAVLGLASLVVLGIVAWWTWPRRDSLVALSAHVASWCRSIDERWMLFATTGVALLVYASVGTIASLVTLGLLAGLLLIRPRMGLPLIAVALPFYQLGKPLLGWVFSMVEILTVLTAVAWFVHWLLAVLVNAKRREPEYLASGGAQGGRPTLVALPRLAALDWGMLALLLVGLTSLLWAQNGRVAAREFRTVILGSVLFFGLLRAMVHDRQTAWNVADAWVLGGALVAVLGLAQWVLGQNLITADGVGRVRAFYGSPNNLALYLGRILPLVLAIFVWARPQPRKWTYGLAAAAIVTALLLTFSRGAWLVAVPISILFVAAARGWRPLALACGLLLGGAVAVFLFVGPGRVALLLDPAEGTTFFRLQLWRSSWAMIRDHPLPGVGLDNFLYQYRTYYVLPTAWEEFNLSHPHNLVLDSWLRLGLPGLGVFVWLLVAFFRDGWYAYRRLTESQERLLVLGLVGGMVYAVAHGLIDNAYFLVDLAYVFALMLALVYWARLTAEGAATGMQKSSIELPKI